MEQMWLNLIVVVVIVGVVGQAIRSRATPKKTYDSQTARRREVIQRLVGEQVGEIDWEHLTNVLNQAGFKNKKGRKLTAIMVKKEHAEMLTTRVKGATE